MTVIQDYQRISEDALRAYTKNNTAFSKNLPGLQIAWDSHSYGTFLECPRKYFYSIIIGYQTKTPQVHLLWGLAYHECLEKYDKARSEGMSYEDATRIAVRHALLVSGSHVQSTSTICKDCAYEFDEPSEICPACASEKLDKTPRKKWYPWNFHDQNKTRFNLVRSIVWYLDQFKENDLKTVQLSNGKPAVEYSFQMDLDIKAATGEQYIYCGHLDRVVEYGAGYYIVDRKTSKNTITKKYFEQYSPDTQMSGYAAAGRIVLDKPLAGVLIDAVQVAVTFSRFQRGFAPRTAGLLDEWLGNLGFWLEYAEHCARKRHWPMNDKSCSHYGGCPFQGVCSRDPSVRQRFLNADFTRQIWDPLIQR